MWIFSNLITFLAGRSKAKEIKKDRENEEARKRQLQKPYYGQNLKRTRVEDRGYTSDINYQPNPAFYDAPPLNHYIQDEPSQYESPKTEFGGGSFGGAGAGGSWNNDSDNTPSSDYGSSDSSSSDSGGGDSGGDSGGGAD